MKWRGKLNIGVQKLIKNGGKSWPFEIKSCKKQLKIGKVEHFQLLSSWKILVGGEAVLMVAYSNHKLSGRQNNSQEILLNTNILICLQFHFKSLKEIKQQG